MVAELAVTTVATTTLATTPLLIFTHPLLPSASTSFHTLGTHLGSKTLEERTETLSADHVADDGHSRNVGVEVGVLDTGLDNVEGSGNSDGGDGTGNRGDEVWILEIIQDIPLCCTHSGSRWPWSSPRA